MKYGETLRQRSIPAWSHYNIDYDDIKHFIKEQTTPGHGKSVSVPGRGDAKLAEFENALFDILQDQHNRIDLFVKSKAGEIRRRIDHAKKQVKQLTARDKATNDSKIPIKRLERYSRLEGDVLKAGEEIKSLSRFVSTQRTAFRKLLKKHKKWTGSPDLEIRFREDVLDEPQSFTKLDLGPLLDDYSETLQDIRGLYEAKLQRTSSSTKLSKSPVLNTTTPADQLRASIASKSKAEFDTAIATIPLGETGSLANYFVHPDNVVELQVLLLQHMEFYTPRSRSDSGMLSPIEASNALANQYADFFVLAADDLEQFARTESGVTVNEREHFPGISPQRAKMCIRWNTDEDAIVSARSNASTIRTAPLKKKYIDNFFDKNVQIARKKGVDFVPGSQDVATLRNDILADSAIAPLYSISSCRSRFIGLEGASKGQLLATLDSNIHMRKIDDENGFTFPYTILHIRQENTAVGELCSLLDQSHLVERVRGFSLQYHALWQVCKPANISQPFWIPILSRDIRKLPPPAIKGGGSSAAGSSGTQSATRRSASTGDGTTAVETGGASSSAVPDQLETPPLRSFRKKRRRTYASSQRRQQYWSEYDHPEEGQEDADAYVLYFDPNEKSTLDTILEKVGSIFGRRLPEEEAPLLPPDTDVAGDEVSSSDEEAARGKSAAYGTLPTRSKASSRTSSETQHRNVEFLPNVSSICFVSSITTLLFAYILATTSKHKYATEVDAGILFAIGCSLAFAVIGFAPLFSRSGTSWIALGVAATVLVVDAIFSGWLLARMLG